MNAKKRCIEKSIAVLRGAAALKVMQLIDHHISDQNWRGLVYHALQAAERGEKEVLLLRLPSR